MKNQHFTLRQSQFYSVISMLAAFASIYPANATDLADTPMAVNNLARPNIMFMIDNSGSMENIVMDSPYVETTTYLASCTGTNIVAGGQAAVPGTYSDTFKLTVSSGAPKITQSSTNYNWGTAAGQRCFETTKYYSGVLSTGGAYTSNAIYPGNYLNWYFGTGATTGWVDRKPGTLTRIQVAKTAAINSITSLDRVRVGLSTYNNDDPSTHDGGELREAMGDLNAGKLTAMTTKINGLTTRVWTPLAETLSDIGRYFTTGTSATNLTLPSATTPSQAISTIFNSRSLQDATGGTGGSISTAPIDSFCQKSFVILMTDGRPTKDRSISAVLSDYDKDCTVPDASLCIASPHYDMKLDPTYTYEPSSFDPSDYVDDVAKALYETDLRPDLLNPSGAAKKNNLATYVIGFGDPQLKNHPSMVSTASQGGGQFLYADSSAELTTAFQQLADDILGKDGSAAAVAVANANVTAGDNASYVSSYNSGTWTGDLIAYPISLTTGLPDINSPIWNTGCADTTAYVDPNDTSKGRKACSTQVKLNSATSSSRKIVTLKDESSTRTPVQFQPTTAGTTTKLSTTQQALLNSTTNPPGLTDGANVVNFLRGDRSLENTSYRGRTHLQGDMVNSEPTVQREPSFAYADSCYLAAVTTGPNAQQCASPFKTAKAARTRMIYIGGNDGMLHAYNASNGVEEWAYVPRFTMSNLNNLSKKTGFTHKYTVDGTAVTGDVNFANTSVTSTTPDWRTILVGGLGKGGRGYYALDITCPVGTTTATATACGTSLTEAQLTAKVLWEFPSSDSTHLLNVGYSYGKPVITKTLAYGWVVLLTSGYNNGTGTDNSGGDGRGWLYVLNAKTGAVINAIDTGVGIPTDPSGLAHIAAYVANGDIDNTAEYAYGGDLKGNVWRFDLTDNTGNTIVYTATTVAVLKDGGGINTQPITTVPELASISIGGTDKRFVYVGTGQYLGTSDVATNQTQTIYGLVDNTSVTTGPVIPSLTRASLQQQTLTTSGTIRTLTTTSPDYSTLKGWYIDLPGCNVGSCTSGSERITGDPILALGALVFTSNIPSSVACVPGGSSWLNVIDYKTGGKLTGSTVTWSSTSLGNALASRPVLIKLPSGEVKTLTRLSDATTVSTTVPLSGSSTGTNRISWRELIAQ